MKYYLLSDLHMEFSYINFPTDKDAILLLAGDIGNDVFSYKHLIEEANKFKHVYYILGNHEYYHNIFSHVTDKVKTILKEANNITLLQNELVELDDNFILYGGTMWTNVNNNDPITANVLRNYMSDFKVIKTDIGVSYSPYDSYLQFKLFIDGLNDVYEKNPDKQIIVMSHHSPSFKSCDSKFGDITNLPNHGFSSDLDDYILNKPNIKVWVHGHTHTSFDYMLGNTRVICNPRGYSRINDWHPENPNFQKVKTFEL